MQFFLVVHRACFLRCIILTEAAQRRARQRHTQIKQLLLLLLLLLLELRHKMRGTCTPNGTHTLGYQRRFSSVARSAFADDPEGRLDNKSAFSQRESGANACRVCQQKRQQEQQQQQQCCCACLPVCLSAGLPACKIVIRSSHETRGCLGSLCSYRCRGLLLLLLLVMVVVENTWAHCS